VVVILEIFVEERPGAEGPELVEGVGVGVSVGVGVTTGMGVSPGGMGREQEAVDPPPEPWQDQR